MFKFAENLVIFNKDATEPPQTFVELLSVIFASCQSYIVSTLQCVNNNL